MQTSLDPELEEEVKDLLARGFKPAWIADLEVGDIFAGPRLFAFNEPRKLFVVDRITKVGSEGYDEIEEDYADICPNHVVCLIVVDEAGLERHLAYGHTHEIYIWNHNRTRAL